MAFVVVGPFAADLAVEPDNLVTRARDLLLKTAGREGRPFEITLEKNLPLASGLGGGSADAAAALRLVAAEIGLDSDLEPVAASLGSDVPACLKNAPAIATGRGDQLGPAPRFPPLDAVLVNPRIRSPTAAVYREYDRRPHPGGAELPRAPAQFSNASELADFLGSCRNDLEAPAARLAPVIGDVLAMLRGQPQSILARMSGSGATCFALCASSAAASELQRLLADLRPHWWVRRCRIGALP
jgi:4-diphosphocytidyl-2-C-methyl-D-erythritol kinase